LGGSLQDRAREACAQCSEGTATRQKIFPINLKSLRVDPRLCGSLMRIR
jgi:hypothetical protein